MTYKLTFALVMLTLLLGLCGGCKQPCVPDFECQETDNSLDTDIDLDSDSDWDSDSDSDSDSEAQNEKGKKPFIWMPKATCEDGTWSFYAELREIQTDKVWVEVYYERQGQNAMIALPLYEMDNNVWLSYLLLLSLKIAMELIGFTGTTPFLNKIFYPPSNKKTNRRRK
jgi:hypothetical protein